jgi:teichoic acid transport system permease protein
MSAPPAEQHHAHNEWALERHVYEPHIVGLPPVRQYLREVWRRREFALELSRSNLRSQHFDTVFGQVWLVLNPILLALVYFVLVDIIRRGHRAPDYFPHLVSCIFAYYMVSQSIRDGVKSVVRGGKLILNSAFPRMLLPLSSVIVSVKRFIPTAIVYIPLHIAFGLPVGPTLLWVIPLFVMFVALATGLSLLVAVVQVYFRDLASFLPYALRIMLYTAPILWTATNVPNGYGFLLDVNPLGRLLSAWDSVLHLGHAPELRHLIIAFIWSFGALFVGAFVFMSRERDFAVRI